MPPRPGAGPGTEIDPQLENVLRNLNVNLEDELTRYRRHRHGRVPPPPPPRRAAQRQTLDLISVPASAPSEAATQSSPERPTPPPPPPNPFLKQSSEPEVDLPDALSDMEEASLDIADIAETVIEPEQPQSDDSALPVHASDAPAEGYLESSEELLRSLAEEQTEPTSVPEPYSPERKNNSLLKLAGLVLVLLGGIGVGFAITYPSQLQNLRSRIWPTTQEGAETTATETSENAGTVSPETAVPETTAAAPEASSDGYKPPGPDLSTREFKELDEVEDLVTLEIDSGSGVPLPPLSNPAQTPLPPATTTPNGQAADPNGQAAAPNGQAVVPNGQAAAPASPTPANPAPASPTPASTAAPSPAPTAAGSSFYVIASYTGDASLNKARELVPDAFVRNFKAGARIQLAAFDNRAQAEEQVTFLTQQGAVVELFGPTNE